MFLNVLLLLTSVLLVNTELVCRETDNPAVIYYCSEQHECCPEGCCRQTFAIPKVSIALGLNICTSILILCFLCWIIQYFMTLCRKFRLFKAKDEAPARVDTPRAETPPPTYSVAVNLPDLPTYEDTKKLVK